MTTMPKPDHRTSVETWVFVARLMIHEALDPDGADISPAEANRWLDALCDLAACKVRLIEISTYEEVNIHG